SRALEALRPVLHKELPLVIPGDTPAEVARAVRLAEEFGIRAMLSGGAQAGKLAPSLKEKGIPVLVSLNFPTRPADPNPDEEEPLRTLERRVEAPRNAYQLYQAGVPFAFTSGGLATPRDFLRNAARAVRAGLPADAAL